MRFISGPNAFWVGIVLSPLNAIGTCVGVAWIAFRGGRTSHATYLIPLLLLCCPLVFQAVKYWSIPDRHYYVWHESKTIILLWLGCYFLNNSFGLLLLRDDCNSADILNSDHRVSIRFLLVAIAIVAAMLAGERWFAPPSRSFPNEHNLFYALVRLLWPMAVSLVLFGVSYTIVASGNQKLVGLGAIGLYIVCAAIWLSYFFVFLYPDMVKNLPIGVLGFWFIVGQTTATFSIVVTQLLIVGLLAMCGYRFAIVQRKREVPLHDDASFDSILANEQGLPP
jgi:hypothetical protein